MLVCGDLRGNLVLFPLLKDLLVTSVALDMKISTLNYFKGAHGISSVCSISVASCSPRRVEIHSVWTMAQPQLFLHMKSHKYSVPVFPLYASSFVVRVNLQNSIYFYCLNLFTHCHLLQKTTDKGIASDKVLGNIRTLQIRWCHHVLL